MPGSNRCTGRSAAGPRSNPAYLIPRGLAPNPRLLAFVCSTDEGQLQPWSVSQGPGKVLHIGALPRTRWADFCKALDSLRSNPKYKLKTPGTIVWLAKAAVAEVRVKTSEAQQYNPKYK